MKFRILKILRTACFPLVFAGGGILAFAGPVSGQSPNSTVHSPHHSAQTLPPALRPALYQALAKDGGSDYDVNAEGCATLPRSSLKACFDSNGAHFSGAGATPLALHLVAYGRGAKLTPVTPVQPAFNANRARYVHGSLTEWWRVLPVGFEQGFTVAKQPGGQGKLILALAASGKGQRHQDTVAWGKLRYGGLVVTDADGKTVPATLKSKDDRILIAVNDVHAAYPLTVDPLVWLEQKVTEHDGAANDLFGWSVAISGKTALVGAPQVVINGNFNQGAAYTFTESGGTWIQAQKLVANDGTVGDDFGWSVALDGTTALIGASGALGAQGAAYVFTESGGAWTQAAELTANDGYFNDDFGAAVALDGTRALIGAPDATVTGNVNQGTAYIFTGSGSTWTQVAKLTANDGAAGDTFGIAVTLDGTTALVAARGATINGNATQGAAYIFVESGNNWTQAQKLTANDGATNDYFGWSVALRGMTAFVAAPYATVNGNYAQGAVYVFSKSDNTWNQVQKLIANDGVFADFFGQSIALSGTTTVIGADGVDVQSNANQGAAYVFTDSDGTWTQIQKLLASDGAANDQFGYSVSLAGMNAFIGAENVDVGANGNQGAAYFEDQSDLGLNVNTPQAVGQGEDYVSQTIATNNASAVSPAVTATIAVPAAASFVSAAATQGSCSEDAGVVTCDFGQINGNAGTATANVTLKATGNAGETIENTASVTQATPPLTASAATEITEAAACPESYSEYDGSLNPGQHAHSPIYQAPAGEENAILAAPDGFQLYAVFQNAAGRKIFRIPGHEIHRQAPAGTYTWIVKAGDTSGAYTLCVKHP